MLICGLLCKNVREGRLAEQRFEKILTANDTGETGGHQAGVHIPKSQTDLIRFLPSLDPKIKNPDAWISFVDLEGQQWDFRYIYYNNALHDPTGTRDEYRITHMTKFFRAAGARSGNLLTLYGVSGDNRYRINVTGSTQALASEITRIHPGPIRLRGWRRVH